MTVQRIYIIVPVYNEAAVISATLQDLLGTGYPVIVVDDGSTDALPQILAGLPVHYIRHCFNLGQGAALETGMEEARRLGADAVVHFDADGQHAAGAVSVLLAPILEGSCDIVFGSRFLERSGAGQLPFTRRLVLQAARYLNYLFTGILLSDAHNGLRALGPLALQKIRLTQDRMSHATEILEEVHEYGLRYREVPVTIRYSPYSKAKGQSLLNSVNILFDVLFKKMQK